VARYHEATRIPRARDGRDQPAVFDRLELDRGCGLRFLVSGFASFIGLAVGRRRRAVAAGRVIFVAELGKELRLGSGKRQ